MPDHATYVVTFQRSVNGGAFTTIGTDDSSPVYTVFDDTSSLADGAQVTYRAVLTYAPGKTVTSATRTVTIVQATVTTATIHYNGRRRLRRLGPAPVRRRARCRARRTAAWTNPTPFEGSDAYGALHRIQIADDTKRVGFIVHQRPPGNPDVKDTATDRFFIPLATPEIWLRQGDARIFSCAAANDTCVVPSA